MMSSSMLLMALLLSPAIVWAGGGHAPSAALDLTGTAYGYLGVVIFIVAYSLVPLENKIHLRKSKPLLLAAGVIWVLLAAAYAARGDTHTAHEAIRASLLEYAELFLFLLAAMTYINALEERNVFQSLRAFLVSRGFSLRTIFWVTGLLSFIISPVADNLTTALLMGAVVMAVGGDNTKFVAIACINIIVAANAGGAFSPFGDITTLMVWQKGKIHFSGFFSIFIPSVANWLIPAVVMSLAVAKEQPAKIDEKVFMKYGARPIMILFLMTIATAILFHNLLHLPPAAGMMLGLGYLGAFSYHIKRHEGRTDRYMYILGARGAESMHPLYSLVETKKSLSNVIDEIAVPAFAIDNNHTVTHWNQACEDLTGVSADEMIGTNNQWVPFYTAKRPVMADLVLNYLADQTIETLYAGKALKNPHIEGAYDASDFYPHLGKEGTWLSFAAAPLKDAEGNVVGAVETLRDFTEQRREASHFDLMKKIARAEWDTLLFFYGVILCVGGLAQFGYLGLISKAMYHDLGPTFANSLVGVLSAIVDNIPVMFAVLTMDPDMSHGQWLLVTLTAGTGGSMLAVGSAAGVALMGTARRAYTFGVHLKWAPIIALGYAAGIICHLFVNARFM